MLVVSLVRDRVVPERNVAYRHVEGVVREIRLLEPCGAYVGSRVEAACDLGRGGVEFHAEKRAAPHALGQEPEEVSRAASGLQDVAALESHVRKRSVHGFDHDGGCVVGVECRRARRFVLVFGEQPAKLGLLLLPGGVALVEHLRQRAPSGVSRKRLLLGGRGLPSLGFEVAQHAQGFEVGVEAGPLGAFAQMVVGDDEVLGKR